MVNRDQRGCSMVGGRGSRSGNARRTGVRWVIGALEQKSRGLCAKYNGKTVEQENDTFFLIYSLKF